MMHHGSNCMGPTFDFLGTLVLAGVGLAAMSYALFQFLGGNFVVATLFPRMSLMVESGSTNDQPSPREGIT